MIKFFKKYFSKGKENSGELNSGFRLNSGLDDTFLFDFKNYGSMYNGINSGMVLSGNSIDMNMDPTDSPTESQSDVSFPPKKIAIKPIDVLDQLETIPTPCT
jgi:hypothetical protein